jgi:hypothetical protein
MMKGGASQDQTIQKRDGEADFDAGGQRSQHSTRRRTMKVERAAGPPVAGGDYERLAIHDKTNVAKECRVQNAMDRLHGIIATSGQASDAGTL